MKNGKRHITWGIVFLLVLLFVIPCGAQEDAVSPPKEPASPDIEEVEDVVPAEPAVEKADEKEPPPGEEEGKKEKAPEPVEKVKKESVTPKSTSTVEKKPAATDPVKEEKQVQKAPAGATTEHEADRTGKKDVNAGDRELLSITEGPFKYRRIDGIRLEETVSSGQMMADTGEEEEVSEKDVQGTGLFGMDKKTTDVVAWIILGLIILLVFILYRVRARERPGRVLRRFPRV